MGSFISAGRNMFPAVAPMVEMAGEAGMFYSWFLRPSTRYLPCVIRVITGLKMVETVGHRTGLESRGKT